MALTTRAHELLYDHFNKQRQLRGVAVDATCGNGYDTEFLCSLGFREVVAFDIQKQAVSATKHRLRAAGYQNVNLLQEDHATLDQFIAEKIDCAMFNFGYLPHGDKEITTLPQSSLAALTKSVDLLNNNGIVSALCYPGHENGYRETRAIRHYLESLPAQFELSTVQSVKATDRTPLLIILKKTNQ